MAKEVTKTNSRDDARVKKALKSKDWHWAYSVMLAGLFLGLMSLAYVGNKTLVSFGFISRVLAFCCCFGLLIPMRFYMRWLGLDRLEALLFNVMGVGPLLCSTLLWLNFLVRTDRQTEIYPVVSKELISGAYFQDITVSFTLADSAWAEYPEVRRFEITEDNITIINGMEVKITVATGFLGYVVLVDNEVL